jgi:hypothetical protein
MRLPPDRLSDIEAAYCATDEERRTLKHLSETIRLEPQTQDTDEYIKAIRSVVDPTNATVIYVLGGKRLPFRSALLHQQAAEFLLDNAKNEVVFLYPNRYEQFKSEVWPRNTQQDLWEVHNSIITAARGRSISPDQVKFFRIDERGLTTDPLIAEAFSLCHPLISMTIARPKGEHEVTGYVFIKGDEDERPGTIAWVLLSNQYAGRILRIVDELLARSKDKRHVVREYSTESKGD